MPSTVERVSGFLFFAAFIAADLLISHTAAVKVAGVSCVVTGITWMRKRSIGVGIEDREPSFFLTGLSAQLVGALMIALGAAMLFQSGRMACVFGWSTDPLCR